MSDKKQSGGFPLQVTTGALAATTAALLGSTLGVTGTVVGAGIASVVTTVGGAVYLRSIERTKESVRLVQHRVRGRWTGTITISEPERPESERAEAESNAERTEAGRPAGGRRRWLTVAAASALAFLLGLLVITGLELVRGEPVSGGQGTTIGGIVNPGPAPAGDQQRPAPPATTTPSQPSAPPTVTVTVPAPTTGGSQPVPPPTTSGSVQPPTTTGSTTPGPTTTAQPSGAG